jgi:hypothetical protein
MDELKPWIAGTLIMGRDADGRPTLEWERSEGWTARPLPGRDRHGLVRPARDYAFERAFARLNARIVQANRKRGG